MVANGPTSIATVSWHPTKPIRMPDGQRVWGAIRELNYFQHPARALVSGRTWLLGLIVSKSRIHSSRAIQV
jgi:DNA-binding LacI/PurR family transcriptional regulator